MTDELTQQLTPPAIHGEAEAGEAAKVRKQLSALIKNLNASTFDLAEALYKVKKNNYFSPKFNTFGEFIKTLDLKATKAYYLCRIAQTMAEAGVPRETYEPLGVAKLRVIAKLDALKQLENTTIPTALIIKDLVNTTTNTPLDSLKQQIAILKGETGDDAQVWLNVSLKQSAREVVREAISVAKKQIGSVSKNDEGISQDASDGRCLELIAADFLSSTANHFDQDALDKEDKNAKINAI